MRRAAPFGILHFEENAIMSDNDKGRGFVYILANPCFPKWLKIGRAKDWRERIRTLNTAVPEDFSPVATLETERMELVESGIHRMLKISHGDRAAKKEFFRLEHKKAVDTLLEVALLRGEAGGLVEYLNGEPHKRHTADGEPYKLPCPISKEFKAATFHTVKAGTSITMRVTGSKSYVVLAGSRFDAPTESFLSTTNTHLSKIRRLRNDILSDPCRSKDGVLLQDVSFSSASEASSTMLGSSSNGRNDWVDENNKPLGSYFPKGW